MSRRATRETRARVVADHAVGHPAAAVVAGHREALVPQPLHQRAPCRAPSRAWSSPRGSRRRAAPSCRRSRAGRPRPPRSARPAPGRPGASRCGSGGSRAAAAAAARRRRPRRRSSPRRRPRRPPRNPSIIARDPLTGALPGLGIGSQCRRACRDGRARPGSPARGRSSTRPAPSRAPCARPSTGAGPSCRRARASAPSRSGDAPRAARARTGSSRAATCPAPPATTAARPTGCGWTGRTRPVRSTARWPSSPPAAGPARTPS